MLTCFTMPVKVHSQSVKSRPVSTVTSRTCETHQASTSYNRQPLSAHLVCLHGAAYYPFVRLYQECILGPG